MDLAYSPRVAASAQQIQFAEPVELAVDGSTASFEAYGRHFSLTLPTTNGCLQTPGAAQAGTATLSPAARRARWRRRVPGCGSPNRPQASKARSGTATSSTRSRHERHRGGADPPLDGAPGSDRDVSALGRASICCPRISARSRRARWSQSTSGARSVPAIVSEIGHGVNDARITRQIEISLLADGSSGRAGVRSDGRHARAAQHRRGHFSEQVGLLVLATDMRVMPADADPFTSDEGAELLEQLGKYREATPAVRARGLAHLMTGKDLDGTTAGIAYVARCATSERGVSLSEQSYGTTISALIMAHELGHNFGARTTANRAVPARHRRWLHHGAVGERLRDVLPVQRRTSCSAVLASASCVAPAEYADVTVDAGMPTAHGRRWFAVHLPCMVRSAGTSAARMSLFDRCVPTRARVFGMESDQRRAGQLFARRLRRQLLFRQPVRRASNVSRPSPRVAARPAAVSARARVVAANDRLISNESRELERQHSLGSRCRGRHSAWNAAEVALGAPLQIYAE